MSAAFLVQMFAGVSSSGRCF